LVAEAPGMAVAVGEAGRPPEAALPRVAPMAVRTPAVAAVAAGREAQTLAGVAAVAAVAPKGVVPTLVAPVVAAAAVAAVAHWPWPRTQAAAAAERPGLCTLTGRRT